MALFRRVARNAHSTPVKHKQPDPDLLLDAHLVAASALAVFDHVENELMHAIDLLGTVERDSNDAIAHHTARLNEANTTKSKNVVVLDRIRSLTA